MPDLQCHAYDAYHCLHDQPIADTDHLRHDQRRTADAANSSLDGHHFFEAGRGAEVQFGTGDRKHTPSVGMVGSRNAPACVEQVPWRLGMIRHGFWGGHFTASSERFFREVVLPRIL